MLGRQNNVLIIMELLTDSRVLNFAAKNTIFSYILILGFDCTGKKVKNEVNIKIFFIQFLTKKVFTIFCLL